MSGHSRDLMPHQGCPLVAVGGSAGSLDALLRLLEPLPADCGMAFLVAVHLAPHEASQLPHLLQQRCALTVAPAHHHQPITANHVYVITPGHVLTREHERLHLAAQDLLPGRMPVIDILFNSLATPGDAAIAAIVLSGANADGAAGLQQIRRAGGLVLVQDPTEAAQTRMPCAAIASGWVNAVLPVAAMPARLLSHFGLQRPLLYAEPRSSNPDRLALVRLELQATLEELDANRQELRSMNQELSAVNLQLTGKLDELAQTNSDLNNFMHATAMPMVFLDHTLRILRYTPRALDLFRLIPADVGRHLSDLHNTLAYPDLLTDARQIIDGAVAMEREVRDQSGAWFLARVLPYQAHSGSAGVMLTFLDVSQRKQSEAALLAYEEKLSGFISVSPGIVHDTVISSQSLARPVT